MRLVGGSLALNLLSLNFRIGLCCADEIVSQLLAPHKIEDMLLFCQRFALVDVVFTKSTIQTAIAVVRERGKVASRDHPCPFGRIIESLIPCRHLCAVDKPALILWQRGYLLCD